MRHKVAVIPGDGIGKEVVPEGTRVLEADPVAGNYGDLESHPVVTSAKTFFAASSASRTIGKPT